MVDFSNFYTSLPLKVVYDNPRFFIIKCSQTVSLFLLWLIVSGKQAFWSNGLSHSGYREYTIDKLLEALEMICFTTYVEFNVKKTIQTNTAHTYGRKLTLFIADLYLSWREFLCEIYEISETDYTLFKQLCNDCKYSDGKYAVDLKDYGYFAKDIYDNALMLIRSNCSCKQDAFLDLNIPAIYKNLLLIFIIK